MSMSTSTEIINVRPTTIVIATLQQVPGLRYRHTSVRPCFLSSIKIFLDLYLCGNINRGFFLNESFDFICRKVSLVRRLSGSKLGFQWKFALFKATKRKSDKN